MIIAWVDGWVDGWVGERTVDSTVSDDCMMTRITKERTWRKEQSMKRVFLTFDLASCC